MIWLLTAASIILHNNTHVLPISDWQHLSVFNPTHHHWTRIPLYTYCIRLLFLIPAHICLSSYQQIIGNGACTIFDQNIQNSFPCLLGQLLPFSIPVFWASNASVGLVFGWFQKHLLWCTGLAPVLLFVRFATNCHLCDVEITIVEMTQMRWADIVFNTTISNARIKMLTGLWYVPSYHSIQVRTMQGKGPLLTG